MARFDMVLDDKLKRQAETLAKQSGGISMGALVRQLLIEAVRKARIEDATIRGLGSAPRIRGT